MGADMVTVVPASCWEREAMVEAETERQKEEAIVVAIAAPQLATQRNDSLVMERFSEVRERKRKREQSG